MRTPTFHENTNYLSSPSFPQGTRELDTDPTYHLRGKRAPRRVGTSDRVYETTGLNFVTVLSLSRTGSKMSIKNLLLPTKDPG